MSDFDLGDLDDDAPEMLASEPSPHKSAQSLGVSAVSNKVTPLSCAAFSKALAGFPGLGKCTSAERQGPTNIAFIILCVKAHAPALTAH